MLLKGENCYIVYLQAALDITSLNVAAEGHGTIPRYSKVESPNSTEAT